MAPPLRRRRLSDGRLRDAILSLQPTAYWPLDDGSGPLRSLAQNWPATVTGSPTYGVAAPGSIGRGVTWPGGSVYAVSGAGVAQASTAVSLFGFLRTTDATAANRTIIGRSASYWLRINTGHAPTMAALQATTAGHCSINNGVALNNGNWALVVGTFDGTTAWIHSTQGGAVTSASSTTLTGSWGKASGSGVSIAAIDAGSPMIGTTALSGVILDRVLTLADVQWLRSVAFGG